MTDSLPRPGGDRLFLADGGLETTLLSQSGLELPEFAAFPLLGTDAGRAALRDYFAPYLALARERGAGFVLDTVTWRANPDWGARLGYDAAALDRVNRAAVVFARGLRDAAPAGQAPILLNGVVGPREGAAMTAAAAQGYHAPQVAAFAAAGADMVSAITMDSAAEATGVARAAEAAGLPAVVSFTVGADGRLADGHALGEAIDQVDAETLGSVAYFMLNCAHPSHLAAALAPGDVPRERIAGLRPNAAAGDDDAGDDPPDLAAAAAALRPLLPSVRVLGGCCGTDERHVAATVAAWTA